MKILVTGACGYIGNILTRKLLDQGYHVIAYDVMWFGNSLPKSPNLDVVQGDIRNIEKVPMDGVSAIIHLANIANDPCGDLDPKLSWEVNVLATMGLAEAAKQHNISQFLYFSSGSVYGVKDEDQVTEGLSLVPISDYNKTKMISERVLLSYKDNFIVQCIRPATVCGYSPRMRLDLSVNLLSLQALSKGEITVFGGEQLRPNIHIQDLTNAAIHLLKTKKPGIFNAGFENLSIQKIAKTIAHHIPSKIKVTSSNDPRSYRLNSDKLLEIGFKPEFQISDAISELVTGFENQKIVDDSKCHNLKVMKSLLSTANATI